MFTGIVSGLGEVRSVKPRAGDLHRVTVACDFPRAELIEGASIACSGVCMTVVEAGEEDGRSWFGVDAAAETLAVTSVGRWRHGTLVNLERPLKIGDELGGHLVSGHVDGLAALAAREDLTGTAQVEMSRLTLRVPAALSRFIAPKGSVALDGVSLTVNEVAGDTFTVLIIPHTLKVTTLGRLAPGDAVNLEVDQMARYAARLIETRAPSP
jgi:riboflavin synthase